MSQPELILALRAATPAAPASLRSHVRGIAGASSPAPRRRPGWRLSLALVATLVLAALAGRLLLGGGTPPAPVPAGGLAAGAPSLETKAAAVPGHLNLAPSAASAGVALPASSGSRAQSYGATLRLRLADGGAVAAAARRAVRIAEALGGYAESVKVSVSARSGSATLVLRVPRGRVGAAIDRLSDLGRVVAEQASIRDLQGGVDLTGLRIVRLERALAAALQQPASAQSTKLAAALRSQILGLQRARAATLRAARDATVTLRLATAPRVRLRPHPKPAADGPFHELGVLFRAAGIGLVYALALGAPLVALALLAWFAARRLRRRREEQLLSRS